MGKKIATAAFVTGAAVGTAAGLMSKMRNRQKVVRVGKQAKRRFEILASGGLDFTKDKFSELSANMHNKE